MINSIRAQGVPGLGARIREARLRRGLRQADVAHELGISRRALWTYEHERSDPSAFSLRSLAQALGVSADWLLGLE